MIAVGVNGHTGTVTASANLTFAQGFLAVTDIVSNALTKDETCGTLINVVLYYRFLRTLVMLPFSPSSLR